MATCWPAIVTNSQRRRRSVPTIAIRCWHFARLFSLRRSSVDWAMHCTSLAWVLAFATDVPCSTGDSSRRQCDAFDPHDSCDDALEHSTECTMESNTHCSWCLRHYCWQSVHCICSTYCRHHRRRRHLHRHQVHPNGISTIVANATDWNVEYSPNSPMTHCIDSTNPAKQSNEWNSS